MLEFQILRDCEIPTAWNQKIQHGIEHDDIESRRCRSDARRCFSCAWKNLFEYHLHRHGGPPFVLLPETSDEWSPPDRWEMVNRQGINWFCDQNGGKWAFPFFRWWFFHPTPSIYRGSLKKMPSQTLGQIKICQILSSGPPSRWEFRDLSFGKGLGPPGSQPGSKTPEQL